MSNAKRAGTSRAIAAGGRASKALGANYPGAIDWIGALFTPTGFGDESRGFVKGLRHLGFPLRVHPIDTVLPFAELIAQDDPEFFTDVVDSMTKEMTGPITAIVHRGATASFAPVVGADYTIARTMWESDGLHADAVESLNTVDEIWVPATFNEESFRAAGVRTPIHVVGGGVDTKKYRPGIRPMHLVDRRSTVFLSIFEWSYRKGWDVLLRAWAEAFGPGDDVTLVLRTYPRNRFLNTDTLQSETESMVDGGLAALGLRREKLAPIIVVGQHLEAHDMPRLLAASDCYVGPSRGEGWGRPYQEAMACGLPVIATRWSGNLAFMDDTNSLLLEIEGLVPIDGRMDVPHYRGQRWAEPSMSHLAELLQRVAGDPKLRRTIGQKARADVETNWQWPNVAKTAGARLLAVAEDLTDKAKQASSGPSPSTVGALARSEVAPEIQDGAADVLPGTPTLLLAAADEVLLDDAILTSFGAAFTSADDVSLLVYGPGQDPAAFEAGLRASAARCAFDLEHGPQILAILPPAPDDMQDVEVACKVSAYVTSRVPTPPFTRLPVIDPREPASLQLRSWETSARRQRLTAERAAPASSPGVLASIERSDDSAVTTQGRIGPAGAPLVSVLVPVFNRDGYLEECLSSILAQSYSALEIIVVDDGSTDGARDVAARFAGLDRRIQVFHNEANLGLVGNHRRCLSLASGQFVKFVHTDDRLRPTAIERLVDAVNGNPSIVIASAAREVIDARGVLQPALNSTVRITNVNTRFNGIPFGNAMLMNGLNYVGEPSSVLFPRSMLAPSDFSALAGTTYTSLLDISSWLSLLARGQLAYIAEPLSEVRIHPGQEGQALGAIREDLEWLRAAHESRSLGYLADPAEEAASLSVLVDRLVTSALEAPGVEAAAVWDAVQRAVRRVAQISASSPNESPGRVAESIRTYARALLGSALRAPAGEAAQVMAILQGVLEGAAERSRLTSAASSGNSSEVVERSVA
ncbi:MAG: glycosyl transferase family 2 [Acidimicrobiaceae bacterium]|nr:glycosyl transferase family 2 [Acidimicrobiaceae bacterium]